MRRALTGSLVLLVASTPAAQAQVQLVPNQAGKPSELRIDLGARGTTCSGASAEGFSCPEASRIGSGSAEFVVRGPFLPPEGLADSASIAVFIAPPVQSGDLFGVEVQVTEQRFGMQGRSVGRLVPIPSGPFGSELRFESL